MDTLFICLITIGIIWAIWQSNENRTKAEKDTRILGLRKPKKYDSFGRESCSQFREECSKHSIDVDYTNMPNLCTYLRILERKGMHIELAKDGLTRYKTFTEEEYNEVESFRKKWDRIVFSPYITADDFCDCILGIMVAHGLDASRIKSLSDFKGNDGIIKTRDSFFIFRALHIMHYHILIRKNSPESGKYEVTKTKQLFEIGKCLNEEIYELKPLEELANIFIGKKISDSYITTEGNYPTIIYMENIGSSSSGLKCVRYGTYIDDGHIILGLKSPFDMNIWNKEAVITEDIIGIEVNTHIISCEYLFLLLRLMCHRFHINGVLKINVDDLKKNDIVVLPLNIQYEIIRKGMPVKNDAEQLEKVFSSYNEAYPLLRLVSK